MKVEKLHEDLGPLVYARLNALQALPASGVLAGQAVASVLDQMSDKGASPINDLDVFFLDSRTSRYQAALQTTRLLDTARVMDFKLALTPENPRREDSFYNQFSVTMSFLYKYRIKAVDRKDLLNRIYVEMDGSAAMRAFPGVSVSQSHILQLISGFDMNCTQVALDLKTQKLIWTPAYAQFFATRQLNIQTCHTPGHTLIRFLDKLENIENCYADTEAAFMTIAGVLNLIQYDVLVNKARMVSDLFGQGIRDRYGRNNAWQDHVSLQDHVTVEREINASLADKLERRKNKPDTTIKNGRTMLTGTFARIQARGELPAKLQEQFNSLGGFALRQGPKLVAQYKSTPSKRSSLYFSQHKERATTQANKEKTDSFVWFKGSHRTALEDMSVMLQGPAFFDKAQVSIQKSAELINFVREHPALFNHFVHLPYRTQQGHLRTLKGILAKTNSPAAIAVVYQNNLQAHLDQPEIFEGAFDLLWTKRLEDMQAQQVGALNLAGFKVPKGYELRELTTAVELEEEGKLMHHCVGGYFSALQRGTSRIFSLQHAQSTGLRRGRTTLELRIQPKLCIAQEGENAGKPFFEQRFYVGQHQGFANAAVNQTQHAIGQALADFLTQQRLQKLPAAPQYVVEDNPAFSDRFAGTCPAQDRPLADTQVLL